MRPCKVLLGGCTLAACFLVTPGVARAQSLSQPDGWEVRAELDVDGVAGLRVGAGLNLHLISLVIRSDGEATEWVPQPAEPPEEGGA